MVQELYITNKRIIFTSKTVADGHGSSNCVYSDKGARLATDAFIEVIQGFLRYQRVIYTMRWIEAVRRAE